MFVSLFFHVLSFLIWAFFIFFYFDISHWNAVFLGHGFCVPSKCNPLKEIISVNLECTISLTCVLCFVITTAWCAINSCKSLQNGTIHMPWNVDHCCAGPSLCFFHYVIANAVYALAQRTVTTSPGIDVHEDHSGNRWIHCSDANPSIKSSPTLNNNLIQSSIQWIKQSIFNSYTTRSQPT